MLWTQVTGVTSSHVFICQDLTHEASVMFACKYFWRFVLECLGWCWNQNLVIFCVCLFMVQNSRVFCLFCFWLRGKQRALFAIGIELPFLPRIFIFPSCFHSILLQFAMFSLQQFNEIGLLSHTTFLSSLARIRMGVTSSLLASPYSKISSVSLQRYSPVKNSQDYELLSLL